VGADSLDGTVVIYFDHGENLIVDSPRRWSLDGDCLLIHEADRVRFQWFSYGRLPSREALQLDEYGWADGRLTFATNFLPHQFAELDPSRPAVQLHPWP
jgi:hypothetical protein